MVNKYFKLTIKKMKMMFLINNMVMELPKNSQIYKFHRNCQLSNYTISKITVNNKVFK